MAIADAARRTAPETAEQPEAENTSRAAAAGDTAGDTSGDTAEDVIWNIETAQKKRVTPPEAVAPTGPDASLASDALEAAFAMIANRNPPMISEEFRLPTKLSAVTRVGLLIPKTGPNSRLGKELLRGAELALFAMRDPSIELLSFDTAGGPASAMAARQAMAAEVDIVVGPQTYHRLPELVSQIDPSSRNRIIDTDFPEEIKFAVILYCPFEEDLTLLKTLGLQTQEAFLFEIFQAKKALR